MKKKLLLFVLCAVILSAVIGAVTIASLAATEQTEGYYTYTVTEGEATITKVDTAVSGALTVPSTLGGYPVTAIAPSAFDKCIGITSVTVGGGVKSIGMGAFSRCSGIESVTLPFVGGSANAGEHAALFGFVFGTTAYAGGTATTQYYVFADGWRGFETYYIPASLKTVTVTGGDIGYGAFQGCAGLSSLALEGDVSAVGDYAFALCANLSSVTLPASVTSIGMSAFWNCTSLETVYYGGSEAEYSAISFENEYANPVNLGASVVYTTPSAPTETYTYTFFDEDGTTVLKQKTAEKGASIVPPANPTKPSDAQYTYTFAGWEGFTAGMTLTGDVSFKATYTTTVNKYTYTFFDEDGTTVLYSATVAYGTTIVAPANPTKAEDALYTYAFDAWLGFTENTIVTEDISFTATYTASLKGTLSLESTTVSTARGLEFVVGITGKQTSGTGGYFVLRLDKLAASFVRVESAEGVTVEREGNTFTVTVARAVEEGETLLTFTLKASAFLTSGEHSFLSLEASETANAALAPLVIYKMGDVNLDGEVDTIDALLIQQYVVGLRTLSPVALAYAETYVDGATDTVDALRVQQFVVGMDVVLGNRVNVTFVYENEEKSFTVEHGEDLVSIPEAPEGYAWSESETAYSEPTFTAITTDRKYYLIEE